jgi:hypothetical protein
MVKFALGQNMKAQRGSTGISTLSLTSARPRPGRVTPENVFVPTTQETEWVSGLGWRGEENLAPTGIRSPDSPARSDWLYRLRYRGAQTINMVKLKLKLKLKFSLFA